MQNINIENQGWIIVINLISKGVQFRKTKGERELIADINKRFKVFCNESYDLDGTGCMNCDLDLM